MNEGRYISAAEVHAKLVQTVNKTGLREFCRQHDLDPGNVSNVANLKKPMQAGIAKALGYEQVTVYTLSPG